MTMVDQIGSRSLSYFRRTTYFSLFFLDVPQLLVSVRGDLHELDKRPSDVGTV